MVILPAFTAKSISKFILSLYFVNNYSQIMLNRNETKYKKKNQQGNICIILNVSSIYNIIYGSKLKS